MSDAKSASCTLALLLGTSGHSGVDRIAEKILSDTDSAKKSQIDWLRIDGHGPYCTSHSPNVKSLNLGCRHQNTALWPLILYLWRNRPTVLLSDGHKLNRVALLARKLTGSQTRVVVRFGMSLRAKAVALGPKKAKRLFKSMRAWYPRADAVIVPSEALRQEMIDLIGVRPECVYALPNPLVDERMGDAMNIEVDHPWLKRKEGPVLVSAGALIQRKDFQTLLSAFAQMVTVPAAKLLILGRGAELGALMNDAKLLGIADRVDFVGFQSNPYAWMAKADLFVLSSRAEGSGAVLVEALACGTQVVSTDCNVGPAEILQSGLYGTLVPVGDAAALAKAMDCALKKTVDADYLRQAVKPFEVKKAVAAYWSVFHDEVQEDK